MYILHRSGRSGECLAWAMMSLGVYRQHYYPIYHLIDALLSILPFRIRTSSRQPMFWQMDEVELGRSVRVANRIKWYNQCSWDEQVSLTEMEAPNGSTFWRFTYVGSTCSMLNSSVSTPAPSASSGGSGKIHGLRRAWSWLRTFAKRHHRER
jgi:hypothetical protein